MKSIEIHESTPVPMAKMLAVLSRGREDVIEHSSLYTCLLATDDNIEFYFYDYIHLHHSRSLIPGAHLTSNVPTWAVRESVPARTTITQLNSP